jgi:hypothetical protein
MLIDGMGICKKMKQKKVLYVKGKPSVNGPGVTSYLYIIMKDLNEK